MAGEVVLGVCCDISDSSVVEALGYSGWDSVLINTEGGTVLPCYGKPPLKGSLSCELPLLDSSPFVGVQYGWISILLMHQKKFITGSFADGSR